MPTERPPDRRASDGLVFAPDEGLLSLGMTAVALPPDADNRTVLAAYVDLVERSRGDRPEEMVDVRNEDLDALVAVLDLDDDDLIDSIAAILRADRERAVTLGSRLRQHRVVAGLAAAAVGVAAVGGLAVASAAAATAHPTTTNGRATPTAAAPAPAAPVRVATTTTVRPRPPIVEDENGVGLIDALVVEADGTGLVPPVQQDAPGALTSTAASSRRHDGSALIVGR